MLSKNLKPLFTAMAFIGATACDSDNNSPSTIVMDEIINFKAMVGDEAYACEQTYSNIGLAGSDFTAKDFRLYVSGITAILDDGTEQLMNVVEDGVWQHDGVALLDFGHGCDAASNNPTRTKIEGSLSIKADQSISQICFDVGVPFELNHEDNTLQASPLNVSGMFWAWQAGHKFFRLDGVTSAGGFNVHLGSTGCESSGKTEAPAAACANPNKPRICLALNPATQDIIIDAKALLADTDVSYNTDKTAPGCMSGNSDPECQTIMPKFGLDFNYTPSVGDQTLIPAQAQSIFYAQ